MELRDMSSSRVTSGYPGVIRLADDLDSLLRSLCMIKMRCGTSSSNIMRSSARSNKLRAPSTNLYTCVAGGDLDLLEG